MSKAERVSIYIDRKNFNHQYKENGFQLSENDMIPLSIWKILNESILNIYINKSKKEDNLYNDSGKYNIHHQGTWLFVSERTDFLTVDKVDESDLLQEKQFLQFMESVDSLHGFNIKYGMRSIINDQVRIKGVDINIVCHMMHNAFQDNFDVAILLSDSEEFVPVVEMVQDEFGKQVYHLGFNADRLRATCFGNIPLENEKYNKWLTILKH